MCLFLMIKEVFASITKCLAISNKIVENLNDSRNKKTGPPQDEQGCSLRIQRGLFAFLTNTQEKPEIVINGEQVCSSQILPQGYYYRATLSVLNPTTLNRPLPQSNEIIQMAGVSTQCMSTYKSQTLEFQVGSLSGLLSFLLVPLAPRCLLIRDLFWNFTMYTFPSLKRGIIFKLGTEGANRTTTE